MDSCFCWLSFPAPRVRQTQGARPAEQGRGGLQEWAVRRERRDFKQAKDLDPDLLNARLYLATAYATEYIPGAPSDDNIRVGQQAIAEFQDVLSTIPTTSPPSTVWDPSSTTWPERRSLPRI
jgi:hypothetical protein